MDIEWAKITSKKKNTKKNKLWIYHVDNSNRTIWINAKTYAKQQFLSVFSYLLHIFFIFLFLLLCSCLCVISLCMENEKKYTKYTKNEIEIYSCFNLGFFFSVFVFFRNFSFRLLFHRHHRFPIKTGIQKHFNLVVVDFTVQILYYYNNIFSLYGLWHNVLAEIYFAISLSYSAVSQHELVLFIDYCLAFIRLAFQLLLLLHPPVFLYFLYIMFFFLFLRFFAIFFIVKERVNLYLHHDQK